MKSYRFFLIIALAPTISGCATWFDGVGYDRRAGLAVVSNSERNFVVDYGGGEKGDRLRRCLEAPGPAALLNDFTLDTAVSGSGGGITDAKVEADIRNKQSIANLYEVSSILQYAHAMSYRLCEATLNGFIDRADFPAKFDKLAETTTHLLELQLQLTREEARKAEADIEKARLRK